MRGRVRVRVRGRVRGAHGLQPAHMGRYRGDIGEIWGRYGGDIGEI